MVQKCVNFALYRLQNPGSKGRSITWHPLRRFQVVEIDILEVNTKNGSCSEKVAVMGEIFTIFVWSQAVKNYSAEKVARTLIYQWELRFGPPEKCLSDRWKTFIWKVVKNL